MRIKGIISSGPYPNAVPSPGFNTYRLSVPGPNQVILSNLKILVHLVSFVPSVMVAQTQSLTAPAVTPAATYFWAKTSNIVAGIDERTAVAIIGPHSCV